MLQRRLKYGTIVHRRFADATRGFAGFHSEEAYLDGALVDVPGITGRIDHRYEDSLVEVKTSPYRVETPDDVWEKMPQNVAQLLIYAAIWPKQAPNHYLVVLPVEEKDGRPVHHPIRVFKVRIQDIPLLRRATADLLRRTQAAVAAKDATELGGCAYWDNECPHQQQKICACEGQGTRLREWLGTGIVLTREPALEAAWEKALKGQTPRGLVPFELATPRRYYAAVRSGYDHFEGAVSPGKADARQKVREAALRAGIAATGDDLRRLEWPEEPGPRLGVVWLSLAKTRGLESKPRLVPAIVKEWDKSSAPQSKDVSWQARQAAAVSAYHGLQEGFVVAVSPDEKVFTFRVKLRELGRARDLVIKAVQSIRIAIEMSDPNRLSYCPDFTRQGCKVPGCSCPPPMLRRALVVPRSFRRKP